MHRVSRRQSRGHSTRLVGILALTLSLAVGLDWLAGARHTWALAAGPMEAVKGSIDDALRILADKELKGQDKSKERRQKLEAVVASRFSYEEMSRRALGAQWTKLSEAERQEFVELFRSLLINSYADRVESYSGEPINYVGERVEKEYGEVRTKVMLGQAEVPLDYRLINRAGDWRVYDVVIDGISLVSNYRGQFSKILKNGSYQDLVEQLRKKSDKLAASSKTP
ncbi:putative ABC transporter, auxiliary component, ATP-dependent toluene efflux transporter [Nitrospira tepida]|uniref:ABC transporter, auxiliary component, ATP-dependent toluene efflux transporter n=1 Tax=Nitrospira tepida TaxID=2973512 RepID=A0AA86MXA2_9BACT|nr:ABC transporter substrate-binding protein [Nitrospira tepida]CAI4030718.1 putative ABC transporter, auxiliary component, ATP-dependent toluene efflux transporter [Nitrospira tepida]